MINPPQAIMIEEATVWQAQVITDMWSEMMIELGTDENILDKEEYFIGLLNQIKNPHCSVLVVVRNDLIVGFITGYVEKAIYLNQISGKCDYLFVDKKFRGEGINDILVDGIVDFFIKNNSDTIEFMTLYKDGLIKVWDKKGYKPSYAIYCKEV